MSWFQNETVDLNALFVKTILFALAGATMAERCIVTAFVLRKIWKHIYINLLFYTTSSLDCELHDGENWTK